jgi:uncharacterized membrane protein YedE/YeeE
VTIDWTAFTPWPALIGGVVIGIAAAILALCNGRAAGISGIVGGLLRPAFPDLTWRAAFIAGLLLAPAAHAVLRALPAVTIDAGRRGLCQGGRIRRRDAGRHVGLRVDRARAGKIRAGYESGGSARVATPSRNYAVGFALRPGPAGGT